MRQSGYILMRQCRIELCAAGLLTRRANCQPPARSCDTLARQVRRPAAQSCVLSAAQSCVLSAAALAILAVLTLSALALAAGAAPAPDTGGKAPDPPANLRDVRTRMMQPAAAGDRTPAPPASDADATFAQGTSILVLPVTSEEKGLGDQVRLMLINKSRRLGAVTYDPGSVAEVIGSDPLPLSTPPEKLAALARERFSADFIVLGAVTGKGPYAVHLVAVRATDPAKLQVLDKTYPCEHHQFIPLEMAKAVYEIFGLPVPEDPLRQLQNDQQVERRWREGPNLVRNPGFEIPNATGKGPIDWQEPGALVTAAR